MISITIAASELPGDFNCFYLLTGPPRCAVQEMQIVWGLHEAPVEVAIQAPEFRGARAPKSQQSSQQESHGTRLSCSSLSYLHQLCLSKSWSISAVRSLSPIVVRPFLNPPCDTTPCRVHGILYRRQRSIQLLKSPAGPFFSGSKSVKESQRRTRWVSKWVFRICLK